MPYINDEVFDQGLDFADAFAAGSPRVDICSTDPGGVYATVTGNTLGNKTGASIGVTEDGATDGRRVILAAITDGSVTGTATATHWAITDGAAVVLASGPLSSSQAVTTGNTFTLDAISITIRDAA